jgi:RNA polymerase sigma-70 factor (ECF subfamily)
MLLTAARPKKLVGKRSASSWSDDPDIDRMMRVQRDDASAFAELLERYRTRVFGHFVHRLGDRQEAEDLTQEVFLRLYRHRKRYQPRARFATWLFHITHNLACNAIRARQRRNLTRLDHAGDAEDGYGADSLAAGGDLSPSRGLELAELSGVVRRAISGLAVRQRTAVELHQFHDRTYAEVAKELDMTAKAAKSLLYRARGQLRTSLAAFMAAQG